MKRMTRLANPVDDLVSPVSGAGQTWQNSLILRTTFAGTGHQAIVCVFAANEIADVDDDLQAGS